MTGTARPPMPESTPRRPARHYYRCRDCLTAMVVEGSIAPETVCACMGKLEYIGRVRLHRVVRVEDHAICDGRCTGAIGPSCDCQCGGEHHGSGRVVTVVAQDLGPARLAPIRADEQAARAEAYRAARDGLDAAIRSCRIAWAFEARRTNAYVRDSSAYREVLHVHERRSHALGLRSHSGRVRALQSLTAYVRKL